MRVTVTHVAGVHFEGTARGHTVVCDQPKENNGTDYGMTPPEFLLVSIGTCVAYYATEYLRTRGLPNDGLKVQVEADKAKAPARLSHFRIQVMAPPLEERHMQGLDRAVKSCLIHNTLLHPPEIAVEIQSTAAAGN